MTIHESQIGLECGCDTCDRTRGGGHRTTRRLELRAMVEASRPMWTHDLEGQARIARAVRLMKRGGMPSGIACRVVELLPRKYQRDMLAERARMASLGYRGWRRGTIARSH